MLKRILRRKAAPSLADAVDPDLPEVSQPVPLELPADLGKGMTVTELSELEARALCAREGVPVFWPSPGRRKDKHID